jgi:hypothetical protein
MYLYSLDHSHAVFTVAARGGVRGGGAIAPGRQREGAPKKRVVKNFFDDGTSEGGERGVARGSDFPRPPLGVYTLQSKLNTPKQKFSYTSHWGCMPLCNRLD